MKKVLLGMSTNELKLLAIASGEKEFRGKQVADWIYRQGCRKIDDMANLPADFKVRMESEYQVGRSEIKKLRKGKDGTFKLLLRPVFDELIETVGMPYEERFSCCVSTQVGCAIGCAFCATGAAGFKRNLAAGEIVDQVLTVGEVALKEKLLGAGGRISHVVFMGMGEPLINYDATLTAVKLLNAELKIGMRNITVSSIGYVPGIYRLAKEQLQFELKIFKERVEQYPTDLNLKYEYGRRLFASGKLDDAIGMLQQAQRDPKRRIQAMTLLGQSFDKMGWYPQAVDTYSRALESELTEERAKDLRYSLGCALRAMGEKEKALEQFSQVAQVDFTYRDVRKQIEDLRKEMSEG